MVSKKAEGLDERLVLLREEVMSLLAASILVRLTKSMAIYRGFLNSRSFFEGHGRVPQSAGRHQESFRPHVSARL